MGKINMYNYIKYGIFSLGFLAAVFFSHGELKASTKITSNSKSYPTKSYAKKSYTKKAPYQGYGKPSKVTGRPKTKVVSGHVKRTRSGGYTHVNPYARSK